MPRKKKRSARGTARKKSPEKPSFQSPFRDLKKLLAEKGALSASKGPPAAVVGRSSEPALPDGKVPEDDAAILEKALEGVRPLSDHGPNRIPIKPPVNHSVVTEEDDVLAELSDLTSGRSPFDITETEEYVEGSRVGIDPRVLTELRKGRFAREDHIDLHGMVRPQAREALEQFILRSARKSLRTVLVIHGRGRRSPGGYPILKHACAEWLSHGTIGSRVLAFTTALAADGGAGAMYVMLRRRRRRGVFEVLHGTKRRD